ncbi:metal-dependent hydrolase [Pseudonocardiaceae bacterium YIM PH 21723]|nr:metal-dependent hydrolase [Pseudonocardiaceae bacterium YIM PH 21723]
MESIVDVSLHARNVEFDWSNVPAVWIPGEPYVCHLLNSVHLILPSFERWFIEVYTEALPLVRDDKVLEDMKGFIGQESMHAESHQGAAEHLAALGYDVQPFLDQMHWLFFEVLGSRPHLSAVRQVDWVVERCALIAGLEHLTAAAGHWFLNDTGPWVRAGADPVMTDLLLWHGAEEVEHRSVAFDVYQHLDGRVLRRMLGMTVALAGLLLLAIRGAKHLAAADPDLKKKPGALRFAWEFFRAGRKGLLPRLRLLISQVLPYFRRSYHPSQEFDTELAVSYLATSPAARAAQR